MFVYFQGSSGPELSFHQRLDQCQISSWKFGRRKLDGDVDSFFGHLRGQEVWIHLEEIRSDRQTP
jgi:hypothetical protein